MTATGITQAIMAILKADTGILALFNEANIFQGVRDNMVAFPSLILESAGDRLLEQQYPYEKIIQSYRIGVVAQVYNKDTQLEEILNLKNAIKKVVSNNERWGLEDVISSVCVSSLDDNTNYPLRGFTLDVDVTYRQNRLTRL